MILLWTWWKIGLEISWYKKPLKNQTTKKGIGLIKQFIEIYKIFTIINIKLSGKSI